jgi:hypothetical protein
VNQSGRGTTTATAENNNNSNKVSKVGGADKAAKVNNDKAVGLDQRCWWCCESLQNDKRADCDKPPEQRSSVIDTHESIYTW